MIGWGVYLVLPCALTEAALLWLSVGKLNVNSNFKFTQVKQVPCFVSSIIYTVLKLPI